MTTKRTIENLEENGDKEKDRCREVATATKRELTYLEENVNNRESVSKAKRIAVGEIEQ